MQEIYVSKPVLKDKFIVMIREDGQWVENGDGPVSRATADRMAREIRKECNVATKVVPADSVVLFTS